MSNAGLSRGMVFPAALTLAFAVSTAAQDEGPNQVVQLLKRSGRTVQAITDARVQLVKTMEVYNDLVAKDAKDRTRRYNRLQKEMGETQRLRTEISLRAAEMKAEADMLFKGWADSAAAIRSPELRKLSEGRLAKTKANFGEISVVGQQAAEICGPVLKTLEDHVTFLGHDLNASAVKSLQPEVARLNGAVKELVRRIDDMIAVANTKIDDLRPQ